MSGIPPGQMQYMEDHAGDTLVPNIIASVVVGNVVALIAIVLRFWSRSVTKVGIGADDWTIVLAFIFYVATALTMGLATRWGFGHHIISVSDPTSLAKDVIAAGITCTWSAALVKASILLLYRRIFPVRFIKVGFFLIGVLVFSYAVIGTLMPLLQCTPVQAQWDASLAAERHCVNLGAATLFGIVMSMVTDILILALPIPVIWGLQMKRERKILVSGLLALGSGACIVTVIRSVYALQTGEYIQASADASWANVPADILAGVEICVGIVAGCAPTYRPLFNKAMGRKSTYDEIGGNDDTVQRWPTQILRTTELTISSRKRDEAEHQRECDGIALVQAQALRHGWSPSRPVGDDVSERGT